MNSSKINNTVKNRKVLRDHAKEAMADYSHLMTWLLLDDDGDLSILSEPQGQSEYIGSDTVISTTGGFHKAHGDGAATDSDGQKYTTQKAYLADLLGELDYKRIFTSKPAGTKKQFIEFIGHASTSAWRHGKYLGHDVSVASYLKDGGIQLVLECGGVAARGVPSIFFETQEIYEDWKSNRPESLHLMLYALREFDCETSFDKEEMAYE